MTSSTGPAEEDTDVSVSVPGHPGIPSLAGHIKGDSFTLAAPPTEFSEAATVWAVAWRFKNFTSGDQIIEQCKVAPQDLPGHPNSDHPRYSLEELLVNPLAHDLVLKAVQALPEGKDVLHVNNAFVPESFAFNDDTFASAASEIQNSANASGVVGFIGESYYNWKVLCSGLGADGIAAPLSLTIKGKLGDQPYSVKIDYTSFIFRAGQ
jgi:hypothetical protein